MSSKQLLALVAALSIAACDDPSPIFGGGWPPPPGGPTGSLGAEAFLPDDGEWIVSGNPVVEDFAPTGTNVHSATPIVVRFSESMAGDTLDGVLSINQVGGFVPVPASVTRVGDGRVFVLLPAVPLTAGETYTVDIEDGSLPTDMTGEVLATTGQLGQFTVADTDPTVPSLVFSWPADGDVGMSAIGELTTIFDRPMSAGSFTDTSFAVTVDGVAPVIDPAPSPLDVLSGFFPTTDTRVWRWISQDADGNRQDLGADKEVSLALSPVGSELVDADGGSLPTTTVAFRTAAVSVPSAAALTSSPTDAIGIANLSSSSPAGVPLEVTVDVPGGLAGDVVGLFMFGTEGVPAGDPATTIAFERSVTLSADGGTAVFGLSDLDLVTSTSPLTTHFADGELGFAFQVRRGGVTTPVRNLDVDATKSGIQDPILDTVAPELVEVFGEDAFGVVVSDQRGLTLGGLASEELRAAEVTTALGDNGTVPAVLGSSPDGSFLAAPVVSLDVIDPASLPLGWTLTIYDRALNPVATPRTGSFTQRGVVGPAALASGANVNVEVFDAEALAPIVGARVYTHRDDGASYPLVASGTTGSAGTVDVGSSPGGPTIVTIVADGYDLFSLIGVEAARLSVPLVPTVGTSGDISGSIFAGSDLANLTLGALTGRFDDPRRAEDSVGMFAGGACSSNPFGGGELDCPFGPEVLRTGRTGALSFVAGNFLLPEASFSASASLQAFALALPLGPLDDLEMQAQDFTVSLLNEPGVDVLELPVELPATVLNAAGLAGVDLGNLVGDAGTEGDPYLSAETLVPGMPGSLAVGLGSAYDQTGGVWNLRIAVPGAALVGGALSGALDPDLFLKAQVVDNLGATSTRRVRSSDLGGLATPNQLDLVDAPLITAPLAGASTGSATFDIAFDNVLPDALGPDGIFVIEVTDAAGRTWRLYGRDPADGVSPSVHLVDLAALGETALQAGSLSARAQALGGAGLDLGDLLWSDLERLYETSVTGPAVTFSAP